MKKQNIKTDRGPIYPPVLLFRESLFSPRRSPPQSSLLLPLPSHPQASFLTAKADSLSLCLCVALLIHSSSLPASRLGSQACSLSARHSCSLTSGGSVLKRSSSTARPERFSSRHSDSSTGSPSSRFPRSSRLLRLVSSPKRDGSDVRQLLPRWRERSLRHWNSSAGSTSIWGRIREEQRKSSG